MVSLIHVPKVAEKVGCPTDNTTAMGNCLRVTDPQAVTLAYYLPMVNLQCESVGASRMGIRALCVACPQSPVNEQMGHYVDHSIREDVSPQLNKVHFVLTGIDHAGKDASLFSTVELHYPGSHGMA